MTTATTFYISVLDAWSNASYVGPFESSEAAAQHLATINPAFDRYVVTEDEVILNEAEFGPAERVTP